MKYFINGTETTKENFDEEVINSYTICQEFTMNCPYGINYETESKDFWEFCYSCPHLEETDKSTDMYYCDLENK